MYVYCMRRRYEGAYSFDDYCKELAEVSGRPMSSQAWRDVSSDGTLRKKDGKFNVYLGVCGGTEEKPEDMSIAP